MTAKQFLESRDININDLECYCEEGYEDLLTEFAKVRMIELVESIMTYTDIKLGHDARNAEEFVEIFLQEEETK